MIGNYQREEQKIVLSGMPKTVLLNNYPTLVMENGVVTMRGYQVLVLEM